jgi:Cysteine-rich secretory protein family
VRLSRSFPRAGKILAAASVAIGALVTSIAVATPAFASASGDLATATNNARAAAGLPALQLDSQLSAVAQAWAEKLAASNVLSHNAALRSQVSNWTYLGENVGMAADVASVQTAFMDSPEHRDNILNSHYTQMGVGAATSTYPSCGCQVLWVVVDFRRPATSSVAAAAKPAAAKPAAAKPASTTAAASHASTPTAVAVAPSARTQGAPTNAGSAAAVPVPPAAPVPPGAQRQASASPQASASASASALGTQLAAAAASPTPASGATDPVSRVLSFASLVSALPSN